LTVFLLAGYHTTAVSISWTIFALAQYPDIYKRAQKEVDDVLKEQAEPTLTDLESLSYLDQVIKESLRVYPPGLFVARLATEDIRLSNGYKIQKDTTIFYPVFLIHKNTKYWNKPNDFNPDRFDQQNNSTITPYAYMPFGHGSRICPGEKLARQELKLILSLIMKNFDFKLDMDPHDIVYDERFVLLARDDIKVKLSSRKN
jgi:cytochrome P450